MNDSKRVLFGAAVAAVLFGCGGSGDGNKNRAPNELERVEAVIGPAGGSLASADGALRVDVPAGAVAEETEFAIEPIANDAPNGAGAAWRLLPSGVRFSAPVTLRFDLGDTPPGGLAVAVREDGGAWHGRLGSTVDLAAGAIRHETDHFSDWTLFHAMRLQSSAARLRTGGTAALQVELCIGETDPETLLTALIPTCKSLESASLLSGWAVNGVAGGDDSVGRVAGSGVGATYTAPDVEPASNPVAVSVDVEIPMEGRRLLVTAIEIEGSDCPLEICRLSCTTRTEFISPSTTIVDTATVTLEYEETIGSTAIYRPTGGTVTPTMTMPQCTVSYEPATIPIGPEAGNLSITLLDDPPNYAGSGEARSPGTTTIACPGADPIADSDEIVGSWHIGYGELEGPPYTIAGSESDGTFLATWECTIEG